MNADGTLLPGIIAGLLFAAGYIKTFYIPYWVILMAHAAIALGTLTGGWRIVHTMGSKITKLQPIGGFAAETARNRLAKSGYRGRVVGQAVMIGEYPSHGAADRLAKGLRSKGYRPMIVEAR